VSFANWDEIIDTCMSYSVKNPHSFTLSSSSATRTPRHIAKVTPQAVKFKRVESCELENPWTNEPHDEMLAREYVYTASIT
jgi:hypothetical protein